MKKIVTTIAFMVLGLTGFTIHAQNGTVSSGGNATGSGGSVSYSIGQVFYTTSSGANGKAHQGVQQVFDLIVPTFNPIAAICMGGSLAPLPTTSTNGITGSWSPALNNMATTLYTFTPNNGQFATSTTLMIVVNALPSVPVTGSNSPLCATSTLNLTASSTAPDSINYSWTGPNGFTSNVQNPSIANASVAASGTYTVTATNSVTGCFSTSQISVTVTPTPIYYADSDNDGYGNPDVSIASCTPVAGYVLDNTDCNDGNNTVHPNAPEICYDGLDNDCDGTIDEGCVPIVSTVQPSQCGTTLTSISQQIYANLVAGAQGYRFRVTDMSNGQVQTIDKALRVFQLTQLTNYAFARTYQVEVAIRYNNVWQPFYGVPCMVTTPATTTQVQASQCGSTLTAMNDVVYANNVSYATGYKFRITNTLTSAQQEIERPLREIRISQIAMPEYNTTYTVEVAVRNTNGLYLPYGPVCTITTPGFPSSQLQLSQCDVSIANPNTTVYADSFAGATTYRFRFVNSGLGYNYQFDRSLRSFVLSSVPGLIAGQTYSVQVSVEVGGVFGPFGKVCTITTPANTKASPSKFMAFEVTAAPNPFEESFGLEVSTSSEAIIQVKVYDMLGKLIEQKSVSAALVSELQVMGSRYPSGVYNVIVSQGEEVKTLRIIKR